MKFDFYEIERMRIDSVNYLAVGQLESLGIINSTQEQIDLMERIIEISMAQDERSLPPLASVFKLRTPANKLTVVR